MLRLAPVLEAEVLVLLPGFVVSIVRMARYSHSPSVTGAVVGGDGNSMGRCCSSTLTCRQKVTTYTLIVRGTWTYCLQLQFP